MAKAKPKKATRTKASGAAKKAGATSRKKPKIGASAKAKAKGTRKSAPPRRAKKGAAKSPSRLGAVDAALFDALSEGERAQALRTLTEDKRVGEMAKVGRYRLIGAEPLVAKPPHATAGKRAARIVVYDYAANRSVEAIINLEDPSVAELAATGAQPMLAREEEAAAIDIALRDERVSSQLVLGDVPLGAMHYWSTEDKDASYQRRSAAVLLGHEGERPSLVAIVDLVSEQVAEITTAEQW